MLVRHGHEGILVQTALLLSDLLDQAPIRRGVAEARLLVVAQRRLASDRFTTRTAHPSPAGFRLVRCSCPVPHDGCAARLGPDRL